MVKTFNAKSSKFFPGLRALGWCGVLFFVSLMFVGNSHCSDGEGGDNSGGSLAVVVLSHCSDGEGGDNSGGSFAVVVLVLSVGALCWGIAKGTELLANKFRQEALLKKMGPDLYQEAAIERPEILVYVPAHDGGHSRASYVLRCLYEQVWTPPTDLTAIDRIAISCRDAVFEGESLLLVLESTRYYLFAPAFCYVLYYWYYHKSRADIGTWGSAFQVILIGMLLSFTITAILLLSFTMTVVLGSLSWLYLALIRFLED
jgi:hypothetical protein